MMYSPTVTSKYEGKTELSILYSILTAACRRAQCRMLLVLQLLEQLAKHGGKLVTIVANIVCIRSVSHIHELVVNNINGVMHV